MRQPIDLWFWFTQILWFLFWITVTAAITALFLWAVGR